MKSNITTRVLLAAALCAFTGFVQAQVQPTDMTGGVTVDAATPGVTNITAPDRAIINYSQFDVASGQTVNFIQPGAASRVLNRINSNTPSQINGVVNANGVVYFVNRAGVTFGPNSVVNAAGIYAAAGALSDTDFTDGFDAFSSIDGDVNINGTINASIIAAFVGRNVVNAGDISVPCGTVVLASGREVLIGSPLGGLMVRVGSRTTDFDGSVSNQGTIKARQTTLISRDIFSVVMDPDHGEMVDENTKPGINVAELDTNDDGLINLEDIQTAFDNFTGPLAPGTGGMTQAQGDTDGDGDIDNNDLGTLFVACGAMTPPPIDPPVDPPVDPPTPPIDPPAGDFALNDVEYVERLPPLTETVNLSEADLDILSDQLGIAARQPLPRERMQKLEARGVYDDFAATNATAGDANGTLVVANSRLDADVVRQALAVYRERIAAEGVTPNERSAQIQSATGDAYNNYVSVVPEGEDFDPVAFSTFVRENNPALFESFTALFDLKRLAANMGLNEKEKANSERIIIEKSRPEGLSFEQMQASLNAAGAIANVPEKQPNPPEGDEPTVG